MRKPLHQLSEDDIQANDEGYRWLDLVRGYILDIRDIDFTFDPASIAASTTVEQTVTVSGLKSQDIVLSVIKPTLTTGVGVLQARISADDTLAIQMVNATVGAVDAPSESYKLIYIKNTKV